MSQGLTSRLCLTWPCTLWAWEGGLTLPTPLHSKVAMMCIVQQLLKYKPCFSMAPSIAHTTCSSSLSSSCLCSCCRSTVLQMAL